MHEDRKDVRLKFDEYARQYDAQRKKFIPCFDDFYAIAASLAESGKNSPEILDLGAGTGLLSAYMLDKYPRARLTLTDLSEKMLDVARERFRGKQDISYVVADHSKLAFAQKFDLIVSSLSIHHLNDEEKEQLYRNMFLCLKEPGVFINADQVLGPTPFLESLYKNDWAAKIERSGLTEEEVSAGYERAKLDKMSTLADQLKWLREAGFKDVDCVYKYYNFVVLYGRK